MPFTPLHLGPALLIGLLLFPILDLPALVVSSVILDVEPVYLLFQPHEYLHGFFHTYLGASIIAVPLAAIVIFSRRPLNRIAAVFGLTQGSSFRKVLLTSLFGVYFHIFLDSFLYPDIRPFYPLTMNPFYNPVSFRVSSLMFDVAMLSFVLTFLVYATRLALRKLRHV